jgi:nicotinate-nucleotide adenylyltransferase
MRIGVFGGTFDPVHLGHLILAEQCREQGRLDQVRFVPAARPPHKLDHPPASFGQRVEMLALALAGQPAFQIDEAEKDRPGPSYTVDTLAEMHARQPGDELFLMIGSDTLADLHTWRQPARVLELAALLVVARARSPILPPEQLRRQLGLAEGTAVRCQVVEVPLLDISSRDLRGRLVAGRSVRYIVPRAVECYIEAHGLYRTAPAPTP